MKLIYGTYNPSKLSSMQETLEGMPFEIEGLDSLALELEEAPEEGRHPAENARSKALYYFDRLQKPLFSCDSGLYFEGVSDEDQPGVLVKRIHGNELTYREMLDYYSRMAGRYGGRLMAYYKNAICLVMERNKVFEYDGEDIHSARFYLVEKPHKIYREGFPLDSLSVEISSNRYYYDLEGNTSKNMKVTQGFRDFFKPFCQ